MKFESEYKKMFSQLHASVMADWEEYEMKSKKLKRLKFIRTGITAACLIAVMSTLAVAAHYLGLKELVLPAATQPETEMLLSLQGFDDSPEYQAAAEWNTFTASYDTDGSKLAQVGNGPTGLDEKYSPYFVYTQEMAEKLDAITQKFSLKLHQQMVELPDSNALAEFAGGHFLGYENEVFYGYGYAEGSFQFDGEWHGTETASTDYQMRRSMKGYFDAVTLNIGDVSKYHEWVYTTKSGAEVLLALSAEKALILAERPESFVVVNVLTGSDSLTNTDMEHMADSFDFLIIK